MKGMRDVETVGKVMQVYEIREFMKGDSVSKLFCFDWRRDRHNKDVMWGSRLIMLRSFIRRYCKGCWWIHQGK